MLIVCPTCATSYLIDPASVGAGGRSVRCARCKTTWFATAPKPVNDVSAFVDSVIAEAEAQSGEFTEQPAARHEPERRPPPAPPPADDFGGEEEEQEQPIPQMASPPSEPAQDTNIVSHEDHAPEPVAIADGPSLVPPIDHAPLPQVAAAELDADDVESFAVRRQRLKLRRQEKRKSSRWTAIILLLFAFNVALVGARHEVVRFLPQTASLFAAIGLPVNLRNLKFEDVRISKDSQDGANILVIEGSIVSTSSKPTEVPRLRFSARNNSGQEVYTWTALPSRSILGPGESVEFSSRLVSPPADASDVMVRFFNAQDTIGGK